jgi:hypothetical protein
MFDSFDLDAVEPNPTGLKTLEDKLAWVEAAGRDPELRAMLFDKLGLCPEPIVPRGLPDPSLTRFMQVSIFDNRKVTDRARTMTDFGVGFEFWAHHESKTKRNRLKAQTVMLWTPEQMLRKLDRMQGTVSQEWRDQMRAITTAPEYASHLFGPVVLKKNGTHYIEGQFVLARIDTPQVIAFMRDEKQVLKMDRWVNYTSGDNELGGNAIATARIAFSAWDDDKWSTQVMPLV